MKTLATALGLALLASPSALAANYNYFDCPGNVRAEVTSPLPDGWVATAQSSSPVEARMETIAGRQVMACKYRMFGTLYTVWRDVPPGHDQCFVSSTRNLQFACRIIQPARRL
jgi:hypothetical protein